METSKESNGPTLFDPTLYVAATPANPSAPLAKGKVKKTRATSGRGYDKPLAFLDPVTRSWKMYEDTCPLAELPSLEKLPPSGMTQSGVLFLRPPWEPITDAKDLSLLPTPRASIYKNRKFWQRKSGYWGNLEEVRPGEESNIGKPINLQWLEWMMGFPIGWTDLEDSETQSSPK